jgi:hypothetical protein
MQCCRAWAVRGIAKRCADTWGRSCCSRTRVGQATTPHQNMPHTKTLEEGISDPNSEGSYRTSSCRFWKSTSPTTCSDHPMTRGELFGAPP